jgi:hypothetical protein
MPVVLVPSAILYMQSICRQSRNAEQWQSCGSQAPNGGMEASGQYPQEIQPISPWTHMSLSDAPSAVKVKWLAVVVGGNRWDCAGVGGVRLAAIGAASARSRRGTGVGGGRVGPSAEPSPQHGKGQGRMVQGREREREREESERRAADQRIESTNPRIDEPTSTI